MTTQQIESQQMHSTIGNDRLGELIKHSASSKVVRMWAKNFLGYQEAEMRYLEGQWIVSIVGYNDSGKTGFTRIPDILFFDLHTNKQVDMIHDSNGATFFEVGMEYSDGVTISKIKRVTGESIWSMKHGEDVLYTNKKDSAMVSTEGVPEIIRKYNKVSIEHATGEALNIRRTTDKLFLVRTGAGDNAKIIHGLLRMNNLTEATQLLNKEKNSLITVLSQKKAILNTFSSQVRETEVVSQTTEDSIKESAEKLQQLNDKLVLIRSIKALREKINENIPYGEVKPVDLEQLLLLNEIKRAREKLNEPIPPKVEGVNTERLELLQRITSLREQLNVAVIPAVQQVDTERLQLLMTIKEHRERVNVSIPPQAGTVDTQRLEDLQKVMQAYKNAKQRNNELQEINSKLEAVEAKKKEYIEKYDLRTCQNCGMLSAKEVS